MRNLDTSAITTTVGMPFKAGTFVHLQAAYKEAIDMACRALVNNYQVNTVYRLYGCINTGTGLNYIISAGALFYNGEVYLVDAISFTAPAGQVAVAQMSQAFFIDPTADPVTFDDGGSRSIHQINKIGIAAGLSGSGIADFASFKRSNKGRTPKGSVIPYYPPSGTLSDFDATGKGISGDVIGFALCNGNNGTQNLKGRLIAGYDSTQTEFNAIGKIGGEKTHTLLAAEQGNIVVAAEVDDISGGTANALASLKMNGTEIPRDGAGNQASYGSNVTIPLTDATQAHNNLSPYMVMVYITEID